MYPFLMCVYYYKAYLLLTAAIGNTDEPSVATAAQLKNNGWLHYYFKMLRLITMRCTSLVPSYICVIFASRINRST